MTNNKFNLESDSFYTLTTDVNRTSFQKYQDIVIGKRDILETFKYEILTTLMGSMSGAIGLYLRKKSYKFLMGKLGKGTVIGKNVTFRQPSNIFIGNKSLLDNNSHLSVRGGFPSKIIIGSNVLIGRYSTLNVRGGTIEIEDFADIGEFCRIGTTTKIRIGRYAIIAALCYIGAPNHKFDKKDVPILLQGTESRGGVTIGNDVWLGTRVTITDGVKIGEGAVIGAHSLVNKDVPPYTIAYGIPAKVVRNR